MVKNRDVESSPFCMSRRSFLLAGAVVITYPALGLSFQEKAYPRVRIASLAEVLQDEPLHFHYPTPDTHSTNILVKLGEAAGGGIGPDKDIVAFNQLCTHMGGPLIGTYKKTHKVLGPCPLHLTTFDLTRHGMVVSGHATEALPQVKLELSGEDIFATGVTGLIYGLAGASMG